MEIYKHSKDEPRKYVSNYTKGNITHDHGAAEMHSRESLYVPLLTELQKMAGSRAVIPVPALINLAGLAKTYHH